ncbi:tail fiber assembly protein [Cupriavidus plantarum]|uniref:tail fiber assembly protein n=1 Tax=Cupriavidus plantarum TaxID=942865 RepID=UPI00339D79AE
MQFFRDTVTGALYAFEDDVQVEDGKFFDAEGNELGPYPALTPTNDTTPPPYVPTATELLAMRNALLSSAALQIAPLQDAVDLGVATASEKASLLVWKQYRVDVGRTDLDARPVVWPARPADNQ